MERNRNNNGNDNGNGNGNDEWKCALTWWNSHKRTIGTDAAYALSWRELMKLMTEVYCPRNENPKDGNRAGSVVNHDIASTYTQRSRNSTMMCSKMVPPEEEDHVRNSILERTRRDWTTKMETTWQQPPPTNDKITGGQNVARAYVAGNNEERKYEGTLPLCNKCKLHHVGPCTIRCGKCNKANRKDCPKIKNQNRGNKASVPDARGRAYALGGGDVNPGSNTVTGTFLLNDHHAYMLFDSGADKSFDTKEPKGEEIKVTVKENKDKSEEKRLEDVLTVTGTFLESFPEGLTGLSTPQYNRIPN
ncbi:hypothetical protein Tco_1185031 [Tanacetum coccineum]